MIISSPAPINEGPNLTHPAIPNVRLDYQTLESLRQNHPAWRLLKADSAPLILSFVNRVFIVPNVRLYPASELEGKLEDELYRLQTLHEENPYPQKAKVYLDEWSRDDRGWLRKFYREGSDEPHFDLTPSTEKVVTWIQSLVQRKFVATESRILTVLTLLRQIVEGSETDAEVRIAELRTKILELEDEIARIEGGHLDLLDETAVKDRFLQLASVAKELLGDFREVEENFRRLDRQSREKIAQWDGTKGQLLDDIFGERDVITDSDQGRSFRAFWNYLMSQQRQRELTDLLENVLSMPAIKALNPDRRIRRIHYDWLEAGDATQRTVSALSEQLRRFLDDQAWLENRRIIEILKQIERQAVELKDTQPQKKDLAFVDSFAADINLPMERPLYAPPLQLELDSSSLQVADEQVDTDDLFSQIRVDKEMLKARVLSALDSQPQITLGALLSKHPLELGLAELVTYLSLRSPDFELEFDESRRETVSWNDPVHGKRGAQIPRVIFLR